MKSSPIVNYTPKPKVDVRMKAVKPQLEQNIKSRCRVVIASPETAIHNAEKMLAENILLDMEHRKATCKALSQALAKILTKKRRVKERCGTLINLTIEGNRMLESVKPTSEINRSNIKVKTKLDRMKMADFFKECEVTSSNLLQQQRLLLLHGYTDAQINQLSVELALTSSILTDIAEDTRSYSEIRARQNLTDSSIFEKLNSLNRIIEINKVLMPTLFRDYFAIKLATRRKHDHGIKVIATYNGQPLANVAIKVYNPAIPVSRKASAAKRAAAAPANTQKMVYNKLTQTRGTSNINNLKPGTYRMVAAKIGFEEQELTVYVNPKEFTLVNIELAPLKTNDQR